MTVFSHSMRAFLFSCLLLVTATVTRGSFVTPPSAGAASYHCAWSVGSPGWNGSQFVYPVTVTASRQPLSDGTMGAFWARSIGVNATLLGNGAGGGGATIGIDTVSADLQGSIATGVIMLAPGATAVVSPGYMTAGGWAAPVPSENFNLTAPLVPPDVVTPLDGNETRVGDVKCLGGTCPPGMPVANVHAMLCSLNIMDRPLTYDPPFGPAINLTLTYNQREINQPASPNYSNLGPKWMHNWLSFVFESDSGTVVTPTVILPGGGSDAYPNSTAYASGSTLPLPTEFINGRDNRVKLAKVSASAYEQRFPDGSKYTFGLKATVDSHSARYFLTSVTDNSGSTVTVTYDSSRRITKLTDATNRETQFAYELSGDPYKITRITDPFGRFCVIAYHPDGHLKSITDAVNLTSTFTYTGDFINKMTTPYGDSTFVFEGADNSPYRMLQLTDPQGGVERVEYWNRIVGVAGLIPSVLWAAPSGWPTTSEEYFYTLHWSKKAMLDDPTHPLTSARLYHWNVGTDNKVNGALRATKQPLETRVFYTYEDQTSWHIASHSRRTATTSQVIDTGVVQTSAATYDTYGNLKTSVDPLERQTEYVYASNGIDLTEVRQKTNPTATTWDVLAKFTYDTNSGHRPHTMTDAAGQVTTVTYNSAGQVRTVQNAKSETTTYWYHAEGTEADLTLDPAATGYLIQVDGALTGATTKILYDPSGRPATVTDSEGYAVTTEYDNLDRPTKVNYPDTTYEEITYDRLDAAILRDRRGRITRLTYNPVRQLQTVLDPLQRITQYNWCTCGSLTSLIDPQGQKTEWTYDVQSRVKTKKYADHSATNNSSVTYTYEPGTSRLLSVTDARNQVTTYKYYKDNALKRVEYSNAAVATPPVDFTYDTYYARMLTMTDVTGTTTYAYNPITTSPTPGAGRLYSVDGPLANDTLTYTYDQLGRVQGRAINGTANSSSVIYDALGRVTSTTNPLGTFSLGYVNTTGRLDHVDYPNGQRTNFGYYPKVAVSDGNGDQRLQQIQHLKTTGGANISTFGYTYDAGGMIQTWTRQFDAAGALSSAFKYDAADQLTEAAVGLPSAGTKNYVYRYTKGGNRSSEQIDNAVVSATHNVVNQLKTLSAGGPTRFEGTVNEPSTVVVNGVTARVDGTNKFSADVPLSAGTSTVSVVATDGSGNTSTKNYQVTVDSSTARTLVYDAVGNLTDDGAGKTYEWDAANRLVKITRSGVVTEFVYDGLGRRVGEKLNGTLIKQWIWDGMGPQPSEERDASNAVTKRFYDHGEQIGGVAYYYTRDHLGSIREMTDSGGAIRARYDYDPYGRTIKISGDLDADFGFTGFYRHQESGLSLAVYRAYDSTIGRWLSRDPIAEGAGPNLYGYVMNDPINRIDPFGLDWLDTASNFSAGFGDFVSFGLTKRFRQWAGYDDVVNKCSGSYYAGQWVGFGAGLVMGGAHAGRAAFAQMGNAGNMATRLARGVTRLFYDNRTWGAVRSTYSGAVGGLRAVGQSLHHAFAPQRWGVWQGIQNAGLNYFQISETLNSWMNGSTALRTAAEWLFKAGAAGGVLAEASVFQGAPSR